MLLKLLILAANPLAAHAGQLWTVQAIDTGDAIACDAFATGAAGRSPYEFRFRRLRASLWLLISYEGPVIGPGEATIYQDGVAVSTLPAQSAKLGNRNAILISLQPQSVNFADLERHRLLTVVIKRQRFEMALWADDHIARGMDACTNTMMTR